MAEENGGWDFLNRLVEGAAKVGEAYYTQPQQSDGAEYSQQPGQTPVHPTNSNPVPENPAGPMGMPLQVGGVKTEYLIIGGAVFLGALYLVSR